MVTTLFFNEQDILIINFLIGKLRTPLTHHPPLMEEEVP
jgi:hypothetical protein